jgi:hypothetical protein
MGTYEIGLAIAACVRGWRLRAQVYLSMGLILAMGLAAAMAPAQEKRDPTVPSQATTTVIILPPQVVFEQLSYNPRYQNFGGVSFESALTNAANANLGAQKYILVAPESLRDPNAIDQLKQLQPLVSRLARGAINDEAQHILSQLGTLPDDYLILVQFIRVKEGPGGSWNPNTGAITSQMSSTLVQAALISTRTGKVTWKNEAFDRKVYRADDPRFAKFVDLLYKTLGSGGGN